jgi:hypothetical protein
VDDVDEQAPEDISYTYSGYAPLTARLVQSTLNRSGMFTGWKGTEDVLKYLPGKTFEDTQRGDDAGRGRRRSSYLHLSAFLFEMEMAYSHFSGALTPEQPPVTLVCFLGGCTYTEIAALRFISQKQKGGYARASA